MICMNKLLLRLYILTVDNTNLSLVVTNIRIIHISLCLCLCVCEQLTEIQQMELMRFLWNLELCDTVTFSKISMKFCVNPLDIEFYLFVFVFRSHNTSTSTSY